LSLHQDIYSPSNIQAMDQQEGDQPYAGLLYLRWEQRSGTQRKRLSRSYRVGIM